MWRASALPLLIAAFTRGPFNRKEKYQTKVWIQLCKYESHSANILQNILFLSQRYAVWQRYMHKTWNWQIKCVLYVYEDSVRRKVEDYSRVCSQCIDALRGRMMDWLFIWSSFLCSKFQGADELYRRSGRLRWL